MTFYLLHNVVFRTLLDELIAWFTKKETRTTQHSGSHYVVKNDLNSSRSLEPLALGLLVLKETRKTKTSNSAGRLQHNWNFKMNYFCIPIYRGIYISKCDNINKSWTMQTDIDQWSMHIEGVAVHHTHVKGKPNIVVYNIYGTKPEINHFSYLQMVPAYLLRRSACPLPSWPQLHPSPWSTSQTPSEGIEGSKTRTGWSRNIRNWLQPGFSQTKTMQHPTTSAPT